MKHLLLAFLATAALPAGAYAQQEVGNGFVPTCHEKAAHEIGHLLVIGGRRHCCTGVLNKDWSSGGFVPSGANAVLVVVPNASCTVRQKAIIGVINKCTDSCLGDSGGPLSRMVDTTGGQSGSPVFSVQRGGCSGGPVFQCSPRRSSRQRCWRKPGAIAHN